MLVALKTVKLVTEQAQLSADHTVIRLQFAHLEYGTQMAMFRFRNGYEPGQAIPPGESAMQAVDVAVYEDEMCIRDSC